MVAMLCEGRWGLGREAKRKGPEIKYHQWNEQVIGRTGHLIISAKAMVSLCNG